VIISVCCDTSYIKLVIISVCICMSTNSSQESLEHSSHLYFVLAGKWVGAWLGVQVSSRTCVSAQPNQSFMFPYR